MGEVFAGRYELVDPIGRGGVGAVWRAWDHRRRRYVAAKVLLQSDAHSLLRFVREQALRIDHPHVLAPTSWAADDDKVLFTMDLVTGGSLVHLVGDYGPLPPAFVCTLLDQLLAGLAAVHAEDVVHRDVKPANVLLEATGTGRPRLRLSDFGIAMRLGEPRLTETNLVVGTPGYLAPEQMMGSEPDFRSDLFAVGLVALYLLEGAKPDTKALIQYFADHGTPGAPRGIPEPLWQVVATLLQPDPLARFRTATGARKALAAAAELLPEPGPDDELIEIFDQLGPLPPGFSSDGPLKRASGVRPGDGGATTTEGHGGSGDSLPRSGRAGPAPGVVPGATGEDDAAPSAPARSTDATGTTGDLAAPAPARPVTAAGHGGPAGSGNGPEPGQLGPDHGTGSPGSAVPGDPRRSAGSSATPPGSLPRPTGMSDTGSFPLPPPQATATSSPVPFPAPQHPAHAPRPPQDPEQLPDGAQHRHADAAPYISPHDPTHPLRSPLPRPSAPPDASTAEYTAQGPRVPPPGGPTSRHGATAPRSHRRRSRRPGPPARVTVPVLLLALACYAVGFWALTRI
ncbi:serine/threonine protein kinase [Streptomyces toyocaensis]|uniref:non-specific serine/threonine protein kinase n=1 Tax=Streptomyces toyocaensis TaxID=55952 RepID=A0A081XPC7_STRTO|nr:serine/threonine-protein kinase [Streptomyces toyocaensis]KES05400.1 serine/threonine protein kinase [Streptomyces toyocaensis]